MNITEEQLRDIISDLINMCNYDDFREENNFNIEKYLHTSYLKLKNNQILLNTGQISPFAINGETGVIAKNTETKDNKFLITIEKLSPDHSLFHKIHTWE